MKNENKETIKNLHVDPMPTKTLDEKTFSEEIIEKTKEENMPSKSFPNSDEVKTSEKVVEEKKESVKIEEVNKKPNVEEQIEHTANAQLKEIREKGEMWVTLSDKDRNFFNSADEAHFFVKQGRCKKLPDELTEVLENAIGSNNPLLKEADDEELLEELKLQEEERLISIGKIKPKPINETNFKGY